MSSTRAVSQPGLDVAVIEARKREDMIVAGEIVRHKLASRVIHWSVAGTFFLCLLTGLPIWTPVFAWTSALFGGLAVCRVLHPWFGFAFFLAAFAMLVHWGSVMKMSKKERGWIGPKLLQYMRDELAMGETGKYNGGQKFFFFTSTLAALGLLLSGLVMFWPESFPRGVREAAILVHDATFILFAVSIVFHIYLSTVAEPGTFNAMTRGTVTRAWARIHHPRWYREIAGESKERKSV